MTKEIYISDDMIQKIQKFDSIIFDCDGVLVDIRNSYDYAINKTISAIMNDLFNEKISDIVNSKILYGLKAAGGFNDEVAVVYAVVMTLVASKKSNLKFEKLIIDVIDNSNESGINSIDNYFINQNIDLIKIKTKLDYENSRKVSYIHRIFNQLFYGPELYSKLFRNTSKFSEPGLIENDVVIFNNDLADKLENKFHKQISMVTGRGKESVKYSLKNLLEKFDLQNSMFLEDEPRELAKPNPQSLVNSITGMNSKSCLYVGDSMEDFIMAKKATILGNNTTFCGIIGTSKNPEEKLQLFEQNEAILVLDSINLLPKVLNLE